MNKEFAEYVRKLPELTDRLVSGIPLTSVTLKAANVPGVYSFTEDGWALYVGRTKTFETGTGTTPLMPAERIKLPLPSFSPRWSLVICQRPIVRKAAGSI